MRNRKPIITSMIASALASIYLGGVQSSTDRIYIQSDQPKPGRKCRLPDCQKTTTHNGGYCCAEHCKLHRKRGW